MLLDDGAGRLQVGTAALFTLAMPHPRGNVHALLLGVARLYGGWFWPA